jgi:hypothetical protein
MGGPVIIRIFFYLENCNTDLFVAVIVDNLPIIDLLFYIVWNLAHGCTQKDMILVILKLWNIGFINFNKGSSY